VQLPESNEYESILFIIDRLTKWAISISTATTLTSLDLAQRILDRLISQHGLPNAVVSDRGSKFTSKLRRYLMLRLGIPLSYPTAFHSQSDGQTERVDQVLEQYLPIFTSYNHDDWSSLLLKLLSPTTSLCTPRLDLLFSRFRQFTCSGPAAV
jgi:transposase InsO family protein